MCLFCKIINGEIPCFKIYEDNNIISFLDISQETTGHTLVLPKKHIANVFELDYETAQKLSKAVIDISKLLSEKLSIKNINILNNSGSLAGQTINHLHVHLIPQHEDENFSFNHPQHEPDFNKLQQTLDKIIGK